MSYNMTNVLIIGGGAGGVTVASSLSRQLDPERFSIQLVTERTFHAHVPALTRVVVTKQDDFESKALTPYDKLFAHGKAGEVIQGSVTRLDDGVAYLYDGRQLSYDWLVLATGTAWPGPLKLRNDLTSNKQWLEGFRSKIDSARNIVIVGGGPVGIEVAGEIRHWHSSKKVTIVHSQRYLLSSRYPEKFRRLLDDRVRKLGVTVVLNDRLGVSDGHSSVVRTEKGVPLDADLVIPLWGGVPNTSFLKSFDSAILTPTGHIRVHPTLQAQLANGKTNVYALGDIIDWDEEKLLAKIPTQAGVVSANILSAIRGKTPSKKYKGYMDAMLIPLGPNGGLGHIPLFGGFTVGDWAGRFKGKTLFWEMGKKMLNYA